MLGCRRPGDHHHRGIPLDRAGLAGSAPARRAGLCSQTPGPIQVDAGHYGAAVDAHTALVSVPLVTYGHGRLLPVARGGPRLAHARGARVFVDAYQAVGVLPVKRGRTWAATTSSRATCKYLLGLPGVAFLYVRDGVAGGHGSRADRLVRGALIRSRSTPRRLDFPSTARPFRRPVYRPVARALRGQRGSGPESPTLDLHEVRRHVTGLIELGRAAAHRPRGTRSRRRPRLAAHGAHVGPGRHPTRRRLRARLAKQRDRGESPRIRNPTVLPLLHNDAPRRPSCCPPRSRQCRRLSRPLSQRAEKPRPMKELTLWLGHPKPTRFSLRRRGR